METYIRENYSYFHIDCSRLEFIQDTESTLRDLVRGKLVNKTHYRRLLLGRKGTGKSILLKVINQAASAIHGNNLIVCSTHYINMAMAELPSTLIAKAVETPGNRIQLPIRIEKLDSYYLISVNKFVLFIADELDSVFHSSCSAVNGQQIIGEIAEIGNSSEGRIHCIISGSSHQLRQLCFGKLSDKDKKDFPNYVGINLNSTKFSARWIHPFLDKKDFDKVLRLLQSDGTELDTLTKIIIYIQTEGNGRHIADMVQQYPRTMAVDSYSLSTKDISPEDLPLLKAIFTCVTDFMPSHEPVDELVYHWTRYVPLSSVQSLQQCQISVKSLYSLADRGLLRYNDRFNISGSGQEVSLGTPMVYLQLNNMDRDSLTVTEAIALCYPHGCLNQIAEQVAMRFLIEKAAVWIDVPEGLAVKLKHKECNLLAITDTTKKGTVELGKISIDELVNCFWKELDSSEANAVYHFHHANDDGTLIAYRIQLQLGASLIQESEATKLVENFQSMHTITERRYAACNKPVLQQKFYLVTTRQLTLEVKNILQKDCITIIDAAKLRNRVWPDVLKNLGKPYK